jgi:hypothetical protein
MSGLTDHSISTEQAGRSFAPATGSGIRPFGDSDASVMRAVIDQAAAALAECYQELPPTAQASAITLGHSLSYIRQRFSPNDKVSSGD